jgi:hypothetical protein
MISKKITPKISLSGIFVITIIVFIVRTMTHTKGLCFLGTDVLRQATTTRGEEGAGAGARRLRFFLYPLAHLLSRPAA